MSNECGLLVGSETLIGVRDHQGCVLPSGHEGPHEFVAHDGKRWQWETDWECDCDQCKQCDGDYCVLYWQKTETQPA